MGGNTDKDRQTGNGHVSWAKIDTDDTERHERRPFGKYNSMKEQWRGRHRDRKGKKKKNCKSEGESS